MFRGLPPRRARAPLRPNGHESEAIDDRHDKPGDDGIGVKTPVRHVVGVDREQRDSEARRIGARVPKKQPAPQIENQRHRQANRQEYDQREDLRRGIEEEKNGPDQAKTTGQTVHTVGHIDGIHHADDHQHRKRDREGREPKGFGEEGKIKVGHDKSRQDGVSVQRGQQENPAIQGQPVGRCESRWYPCSCPCGGGLIHRQAQQQKLQEGRRVGQENQHIIKVMPAVCKAFKGTHQSPMNLSTLEKGCPSA